MWDEIIYPLLSFADCTTELALTSFPGCCDEDFFNSMDMILYERVLRRSSDFIYNKKNYDH